MSSRFGCSDVSLVRLANLFQIAVDKTNRNVVLFSTLEYQITAIWGDHHLILSKTTFQCLSNMMSTYGRQLEGYIILNTVATFTITTININ